MRTVAAGRSGRCVLLGNVDTCFVQLILFWAQTMPALGDRRSTVGSLRRIIRPGPGVLLKRRTTEQQRQTSKGRHMWLPERSGHNWIRRNQQISASPIRRS
ncbi:hypothetical protein N657DRAFT_5491 [Parathielavia appendiculata]|uniref:Uncharacterized protein n=1 Tax=Parathielavia appendiculata TaxID=2587402 RepID=A0AAN6U846_9PEZI|nr:hypothetical protein N657DRAFT_5491 [Parathielavia appendiculata]